MGVGGTGRPADNSARFDRVVNAWWRAINRNDDWLATMRDAQEYVRHATGADILAVWAELPPRGDWYRITGQLAGEAILSHNTVPHHTVAETRQAVRVMTATLQGAYREILRDAGMAGAWLVPLEAEVELRDRRQWVGAVGLGWRHHVPDDEPRVPLRSVLWYLVGHRVEEVYTEAVIEAATGWGPPLDAADWTERLARVGYFLGGSHWVLFRLTGPPARPTGISVLAEHGTFGRRGQELVMRLAPSPDRLARSAIAEAVRQGRNLFIEDMASRQWILPGDPARSALVLPLGSSQPDEHGVLNVYWPVPTGWRQFGLSMRPWDAFRRVAAEWWQHAQVIRDATHDRLTGALNRRGLAESWQRWQQREAGGLLGVLDIDYFAEVNNRWGHLMGDEVLKAVSRILETLCDRVGGDFGRWGGDEFVLLLPEGFDWEAGGRFIRAALAARAARERWPESVTVSGGAARWRRGDDWEATFARADHALYEAKRSGRSRFWPLPA